MQSKGVEALKTNVERGELGACKWKEGCLGTIWWRVGQSEERRAGILVFKFPLPSQSNWQHLLKTAISKS